MLSRRQEVRQSTGRRTLSAMTEQILLRRDDSALSDQTGHGNKMEADVLGAASVCCVRFNTEARRAKMNPLIQSELISTQTQETLDQQVDFFLSGLLDFHDNGVLYVCTSDSAGPPVCVSTNQLNIQSKRRSEANNRFRVRSASATRGRFSSCCYNRGDVPLVENAVCRTTSRK